MNMDLSDAIFGLIKKASTELPPDVLATIEGAYEHESGIAKQILGDLIKNSGLALEGGIPICQDTGVLNFFVKIGNHKETELMAAITKAVATALAEGILRPNSVDSLTGKNVGSVPEVHFEKGDFEIALLLKGGGSEDVSTQYKLPDESLGAGRDLEGAEKCVIDAVFKAQGAGCSPYFVGVCIGGQRDSGYLEAKKQLFRRAGARKLAGFERSVRDKLNSLGIGPMGLGGKTTALEVFVSALPRHPANFFVSVSLNCWALRRWTMRIKAGEVEYY